MDCKNECVSLREDLDSANACCVELETEMNRLMQDNKQMKEYIKQYGYCEYHKEIYSKVELKVFCQTCSYRCDCERYQILEKHKEI